MPQEGGTHDRCGEAVTKRCGSYARMRRWRAQKRLEEMCRVVGLDLSPQSSMVLWKRPGVFISYIPVGCWSKGSFGGE